MRIGIDIDDTTFITVKSMLKYADIYDKEILGKKGIIGSYGLIKNRYYLHALYGWTDDEKKTFFNMYYKDVLKECTPMENAPEVITKLKNQGHEIYFITARLTNIEGCNTNEITKNSLDKFNIPYHKLIINAPDKLKCAKDHNIDIFIEDSAETCDILENNGIKSYLMTTKMNAEIDAKGVERVNTWEDIYISINNYIKENNYDN